MHSLYFPVFPTPFSASSLLFLLIYAIIVLHINTNGVTMVKDWIQSEKYRFPLIKCGAAVVGSGAAAWNAAHSLITADYDVCLFTEGVNMGTSRNTGSDKQTYYKLATGMHTPDCAENMARDLFSGGSMHGDLALTEAVGSLKGFFKLVSLGVPFPHDRFGEYPGYRTDHDSFSRATSCGPLTSKYMTEALERACRDRNLTVFDSFRAVKVLSEDGVCRGFVCISPHAVSEENPAGITVVITGAVVWAVGGPSAVYSGSVYPESQNCSLGAALLAGAEASNLTESQYGIASLKFRWNLSGSYQQVIPRYVSVDENGTEREFLTSVFPDHELAEAVFLKGYEWPFDPSKIRLSPEHKGSRSSEVDIAVYREVTAGRRVYLDFRRNPSVIEENGLEAPVIGETAYEYLRNCGSLDDTPIRRLRRMNERAYQLYLDHGIDLESEMLEISVCAQHLNGGLSVTIDYESPTLANFYPCGECAGVFGIKRPGGSALNSTQVSSSRAADAILAKNAPPSEVLSPVIAASIAQAAELAKLIDENGSDIPAIVAERTADGKKHDECAAFLRDSEKISLLIAETAEKIRSFGLSKVKNHAALTEAMITYDTLITRYAMLSAISAYITDGGKSRGSYLITTAEGLDTEHRGFVLNTSVSCQDSIISASNRFEPVRPIPEVFNWFENVYNAN